MFVLTIAENLLKRKRHDGFALLLQSFSYSKHRDVSMPFRVLIVSSAMKWNSSKHKIGLFNNASAFFPAHSDTKLAGPSLSPCA